MNIIVRCVHKIIICSDIAERNVRKSIYRIAQKIVYGTYSLPGILHCKSIGLLHFMKELSCLFDAFNATHFVTGGFAYDARRGRLTRFHHDVDFAMLKPHNLDEILASLAQKGFIIDDKKNGHYKISKKYFMADLFVWEDADEKSVEIYFAGKIIRMPKSFLKSENAEFYGIEFQRASDEFIVSMEPYIKDKKTKAYISTINSTSCVYSVQSTKKRCLEIEVCEMRKRNENRIPDTVEEGLRRVKH